MLDLYHVSTCFLKHKQIEGLWILRVPLLLQKWPCQFKDGIFLRYPFDELWTHLQGHLNFLCSTFSISRRKRQLTICSILPFHLNGQFEFHRLEVKGSAGVLFHFWLLSVSNQVSRSRWKWSDRPVFHRKFNQHSVFQQSWQTVCEFIRVKQVPRCRSKFCWPISRPETAIKCHADLIGAGRQKEVSLCCWPAQLLTNRPISNEHGDLLIAFF